MALRDTWHRALVYFGLAEDEEAYAEPVRDRDRDRDRDRERERPAREPEAELEDSYRERPNVRRLTPRRRSQDYDDWTESEADSGSSRSPLPAAAPPVRSARPLEAVPNPNAVRVHLVLPRSFNDAQQIADRFKQSIPVILNLQSSDSTLSIRLIDFASGLTYALDGGMQKIAEKTFLLTPRNVEVSAEEKARLVEKGFFNQS